MHGVIAQRHATTFYETSNRDFTFSITVFFYLSVSDGYVARGSTLFIDNEKVSHKAMGSTAATSFERNQLSRSKC